MFIFYKAIIYHIKYNFLKNFKETLCFSFLGCIFFLGFLLMFYILKMKSLDEDLLAWSLFCSFFMIFIVFLYIGFIQILYWFDIFEIKQKDKNISNDDLDGWWQLFSCKNMNIGKYKRMDLETEYCSKACFVIVKELSKKYKINFSKNLYEVFKNTDLDIDKNRKVFKNVIQKELLSKNILIKQKNDYNRRMDRIL